MDELIKTFEKKFMPQNLSLVAYEKPFKIYPQNKLIETYLKIQGKHVTQDIPIYLH